MDIFFVLLYGLRRRASPFCLRSAPAVPSYNYSPTTIFHFTPQLLSQRPRRGIAALRAGACTASTIHCLIPRENCISNFHCPQRGRPSLNIVLSLKPTFNIVQTLRGIRCNYPLTCFAGHYHFIKRLCRRHCVPLTLSKAGCAPAVPTETIHQQLYFILPPPLLSQRPRRGIACSLQSKLQALSYPPKKKPCRLFLLPPEGAGFLDPCAFTKTYFQHSANTTRCPLQLSTNH